MKLLPKVFASGTDFRCEIYIVKQISPLLVEKILHSERSMTRDELFDLLKSLGFHEIDILDAISEASGRSIDPKSEYGQSVREAQAILGHPTTPSSEDNELPK